MSANYKVGDKILLTGAGWHGIGMTPKKGTVVEIDGFRDEDPTFTYEGAAWVPSGAGEYWGAELVTDDANETSDLESRVSRLEQLLALRDLQDIETEVEEEYGNSNSQIFNAWMRITKHEAFKKCYDSDSSLIEAMLARLDELVPPEEASELKVGSRVRIVGTKWAGNTGVVEGKLRNRSPYDFFVRLDTGDLLSFYERELETI